MAHPYSPPDLFLPDYVPNDKSPLTLCSTVGGLAFAIAAGTWVRLGEMAARDKATVCWFFISGLLHAFFEGYFLIFHGSLQSRVDIPAQLWKEYALSDSRYLSGDTFVLAIEHITVILWGPLCLLAAAATARRSSRRHALQMLASLAHLYGCLLYFVTSWVDGYRHGRSEPYYFWFYFVALNAPWILVPVLIIYCSFTTIADGISRAEDMGGKKTE